MNSSNENRELSYNVCLMGASVETGNMGVSALACSLMKLIREVRGDAKFFLFVFGNIPKTIEIEVAGEKLEVEIVNIRLSPKAKFHQHLFGIFLLACIYRLVPFSAIRTKIVQLNPSLKMLCEARFIGDIRGGDSFSDIYGLKRFLIGSMPSFIPIIIGKRLVLLPQTYGPYRSILSRLVARIILRNANTVLSRDYTSIHTVRELMGNKSSDKYVHFCNDVAFVLDADKPNTTSIFPPMNISSNTILVGININGLLFNGGYNRTNMFGLRVDYRSFVMTVAKRLLEVDGVNVLLVPHTFAPDGYVESDPDACKELFRTLKESHSGRVYLVTRRCDQYEIKGIIGLCNFFVGSRMHSCIAALSQSIPTVAVAYSDKFWGIFESVGFSELVVDARVVDEKTAIEMILESFGNRKKIENDLRPEIARAQYLIRQTFQQIINDRALQ